MSKGYFTEMLCYYKKAYHFLTYGEQLNNSKVQIIQLLASHFNANFHPDLYLDYQESILLLITP